MPPLDFPYEPAWQQETLTLLHFLWQGLIVAVLLMLVLWLFRVRRARTRYALSLLALLVMAACPLVTLVVLKGPALKTVVLDGSPDAITASELPEPLRDTPPPIEESLDGAGMAVGQESARSGNTLAWRSAMVRFVRTHQRQLLVGWSIGVLLLSLRLLLSLIGLYWVRRGQRPIPAELRDTVARLGKQLGMRLSPLVLASEKIREALVVGFLRPMVLLPASWLMEMTPEVLEAVIAHELAHIRRWDLWINVFQRIVETVLFYHPAVWWLSRRVRLEREMCCDELAVAATGRRGVYVDALELMARKRFVPAKPALASAIGGNKMVLLNRIRYIAGFSPSHDRARWWPVGILTLLVPLAMWLASTSAPQPGQGEARAEEEQPPRVARDEAAAAPGGLLRTFRKPTPLSRQFGRSFALMGNDVLVGAHNDNAGGRHAGAAHLFDGTTGKLIRTFKNPMPASWDSFGRHVAAMGSNVLIADQLDDAGAQDAGAVYLFHRATGKLLHTFQNPKPTRGAWFGYHCTFTPNRNVLVGDPRDDMGAENAGAVYLFDGGTGKLLRTFKNPAPAAGDHFGWYVAALGGNNLVGAPLDDEGGEDAGAVYMFDRSSGKLVRTFRDPTPAAGEYFGNWITRFGNDVLIGSPCDGTAAPKAGAVHLFEAATGKVLRTFVNPSPGSGTTGPFGDLFGRSIATVGHNVLIGANYADAGAENAGAAYLFDGNTAKLLRAFRDPAPAKNGRFGICVGALGNNVLVSACAWVSDDPEAETGAVYLFKGVGGPTAGDVD